MTIGTGQGSNSLWWVSSRSSVSIVTEMGKQLLLQATCNHMVHCKLVCQMLSQGSSNQASHGNPHSSSSNISSSNISSSNSGSSSSSDL